METQTKEITLPSGKKVVLKQLTGGDFLDATASNSDADVTKHELSRRLVIAATASIDGVTENVADLLRALPIPDYVEIAKEVGKMISGDFSGAKTLA